MGVKGVGVLRKSKAQAQAQAQAQARVLGDPPSTAVSAGKLISASTTGAPTQCSYNILKACGSAPPPQSSPTPSTGGVSSTSTTTPATPTPGPAMPVEVTSLGSRTTAGATTLTSNPRCVNLLQVLNDGGEDALFLSPKLTGSICCYSRGREGFGWGYQSRSKECSLHLSCVENMFVEWWLASYFKVDHNSVRELHTKIPRLNMGVGKMASNNRNGLGKYGEVAREVPKLVVCWEIRTASSRP
ncbi:hypothetical protein MLD38_027075 [Melastoma candidum]|uniref:Uncharacterized protein n=1 Tax=Melastoma candidum TaxID=119954 RepID=A0ACB9P0C4_9MYRT|nr:hypothetical protein MLD38_027075 [Melastoma candidum]